MTRLCWQMGWRLLRREWRAGELTVLALALLVAVTAMSSVAFFAGRIEQALTRQAGQLLAADLVASSDHVLPQAWRQQALAAGLVPGDSATFPSMVFAREQAALATLKAVSSSYPLRGEVSVRRGGTVVSGRLHPARGEVWADRRLMQKLGLQEGDTVRLGNASLRLGAEIVREPDGAIDLYNFIPRLLLNHDDLPATGLIQNGSRVRYRLLLAGDAQAIAAYRQWLQPRLDSHSRLEDVSEARPEIKSALERARRFLGLTAMLTVLLAAAAVALAVRRYLARHWQSVAVLRALGLRGNEVAQVWGSLLLWLALLAGVLGSVLAYGLQALLLTLLRQWLGDALPAAPWPTWLAGPLAALILLAGFALPPLLALRRVPALAVLRADLPVSGSSVPAPLLAVGSLLGLAAWQLGDATLALWLLGGLAVFFAVSGLLLWGGLAVLRRLPPTPGWRYGLSRLARRPWLSVIQLLALSVGLMALLTLSMVRADLIQRWQQSLPATAPDSFLINVQPDQQAPLARLFRAAGQAPALLAPMSRARLLTINGRVPQAGADERAQRLLTRDFNLSWRDAPPANRLSAGQWWPQGSRAPAFSLEQGLADTLGIRVGDVLQFDIGGTRWQAPVTSLRQVAWDSFQPNFFVLAPTGWMGGESASYIGSYRAPDGGFNNRVVAALPNVTVVDISALVQEVKAMVARLALAVEAMFGLALIAGVLVLWAALAATRDERLFDAALLRALGASRRQLCARLLGELLWLGALAGMLAGAAAMALGSVLAVKLFNLAPAPYWGLLPAGMLGGALLVTLAAWPLLRRVLDTAPADILRNS